MTDESNEHLDDPLGNHDDDSTLGRYPQYPTHGVSFRTSGMKTPQKAFMYVRSVDGSGMKSSSPTLQLRRSDPRLDQCIRAFQDPAAIVAVEGLDPRFLARVWSEPVLEDRQTGEEMGLGKVECCAPRNIVFLPIS